MFYAFDIDFSFFVLEIVFYNIIDRIWIVSEVWIILVFIVKFEYFLYFGGSIGFVILRVDILGLKEFFYDVYFSKDLNDVLIIEFW